ncbi:MAG: citrate/2-methylcitrate synthase [Defluviitaleaceae bacterium]|nr:citrate/2-methylcitrate synthase [Defluviitaleaceae bacterium]
MKNTKIPGAFYQKFNVKKGLRDHNGKGVMAGLTNISKIEGFDKDGNQIPGVLEYRTYSVKDIVGNLRAQNRFGFEEVTYLILFGELPTQEELQVFSDILAAKRALPKIFVRDVILPSPSADVMNSMSRSILTLASYDDDPANISIEKVLDQSLYLIAQFPLLAIYAYHAYNYGKQGESLYIHYPDPKLTTAENILRLLRPDKSYTDVEAKVLDIALILHMEHGGGNNSTFTTHVVTSSGTDTYAAIAASLSSLKGPKHGGANIKASYMLDDIKKNVKNHDDDDEIAAYLDKILNKEVFDKKGLLYGIGHAIYTESDPRFEVFKMYLTDLAQEKGLEEEFRLYEKVEQLAPEAILRKHQTYKGISPNVDFYSGLVYKVLGIPEELYTPLFAIARIVGWSAHRMEELINMNKIIRPAYASVAESKAYIELDER